MKTFFRKVWLFACLCGALALIAPLAQAADPVPGKAARLAKHPDEAVKSRPRAKGKFNPATGSDNGQETRVLTGSHLRQTYTVYGHNTDAAQPVYVIDRRDPRFSNEATVAGALRKLPFATVGGR